jgi:hypothetical protein
MCSKVAMGRQQDRHSIAKSGSVQIKGRRKRRPTSRVPTPLRAAPPQNSTVDPKLIKLMCATSERIDL